VRIALLFLWVWVSPLFAVLPLPYPLEPLVDVPEVVGPRDAKTVKAYSDLQIEGQRREMELPHFENPTGTLGFTEGESFHVPADMRERVEFWKKIFSEYNSNQAVLHDSDIPEVIYGVVDIREFNENESLTPRRRARAINKRLKVEKRIIEAKLARLHAKQNNPLETPVELLTLSKMFDSQKDNPRRFQQARRRIRAQTGQRDRVVQGFLYGGRYFTRMMEIFEKERLPKELTRLPLVESSFNLNARSKVGASGVWQFMRGTGKRFLRIDRSVDERNDPLLATQAAAGLLRQNFDALGSWPLAVTAYNHGRNGIARAVQKLGTTNLAEIIQRYKSRTFGFASSNFYAELLAMIELEREYRKHFGKLMVDPPLQFAELKLGGDVEFDELAEACGVAEKELAALNPALTDWVISGKGRVPRGYSVKVPPTQVAKCKSGYRNVTEYATE